jgi:hypothetical protein
MYMARRSAGVVRQARLAVVQRCSDAVMRWVTSESAVTGAAEGRSQRLEMQGNAAVAAGWRE